MPNQLSDGDLFECTAITVADLAGNILGFSVNPDFTYAATTFLSGATPGVDPLGADPWTALQSAVGYGVLPQSMAAFTAKTKGELYASDFRDYGPTQRDTALQHQMIALKNVGKNYDNMIAWMQKTSQGVMIPLTWFSGFGVAPNGVIPAPYGETSNHCVAAYLDTDNQTVLIKPWLGDTWGRGGYGILTRELFNTIVVDVFAFDPNGSHWWAIVAILLKKFPYLKDYLSAFALTNGDIDITHTDILYPDWNTPHRAYHNTRVLCDNAGFSLKEKNDLSACIYQESRFQIGVEGKINSNGTHDWGLCQFNDGSLHGVPLWIGPGAAFASVQEVLTNPAKCVNVMIAEFKAGHANWWMSHSQGTYIQWLAPNSPMWKL